MVSVKQNSEVVYRIMVVPKHTPDKEAFIKRIKGNEENMTDCDEEEKNTLTEWLSQYKETIIQSIRKDAMTFIEILKGDSNFLDENIRKDIDSLTRTPRLSCRGMCRYYTIILAQTTINKERPTEYILHDKETSTECVLQNIERDNKALTYCILHNTIIERPSKCILEDKETMTERSLQDKETMTEGSLQDKETMTAHTTHMRELFEPGCPSAIDITPTTIQLSWDEPIAGADWYEIKCEQKHISVVCYYKTSGNSSKYIVKGLKRNTEYEFTIQAVKKEVNKGPYSKPLKVSTSVISNYDFAAFVLTNDERQTL
ncbi:hypothetical protein AM593_02627, partial [Mytilus galloprovincialis]